MGGRDLIMADFSWAPRELQPLLLYKDKGLKIKCAFEGCNGYRSTGGKGAILKSIEKFNGFSHLLYCRQHGGVRRKFTSDEVSQWPDGYKRCKTCLNLLPFSNFHKHKQALFGYATECKECRVISSKRQWKNARFETTIVQRSKFRAMKKNIPHNITEEDIIIPEYCPILGVKIEMKRNSKYGPSIDQIVPGKGYIKGNIQIISRRANYLKSNITPDEVDLLYRWFEDNDIFF